MFDDLDINIIEVWTESRGKKSNTFIHGWNIDDNELKNHLKIIKKKKGCNGSLKELVKDIGKIKVIQLQGNIKDFVVTYLKENGINEENIKIKL